MTDAYVWYQELLKPSWAPPAWLFGPVWSVLYVLIAVSFCFVIYRFAIGRLPGKVTFPFVINLCANVLFTPFQFGLRSNLLAAADIVIVLATLVWAMIAIRRFHPWVTWINIPYLLWVTFATVLQLTITYINSYR